MTLAKGDEECAARIVPISDPPLAHLPDAWRCSLEYDKDGQL